MLRRNAERPRTTTTASRRVHSFPRGPGPHQDFDLARLTCLRLDRGDRDGVDDVFGLAAAGEVVAGAVEALEDRADRGAAGEAFGKFVSDVAGVQVGENKDVRAAGDAGAWSFR